MGYLAGWIGALALAVATLAGCSEEGGEQTVAWCEVDSPRGGRDFTAVSFPDPLVGTVIEDIGRTTNGGITWTMQESPVENGSYSDVMFTDVDTGTIVGSSGTILRTTDAGATWANELNNADYWHWDQSLVDPIRIEKTFYGVSMADADNGVAVGEFYSVARRTTVSDAYGVCDPWCSKIAECDPEGVAGCDIECLCTLRYSYDISPECEQAMLGSLRCFSALTCEQIDAYFDDPDNHPCTAAEDRIDMDCNPDVAT